MAVNDEGLLAVADEKNKCVHLLTRTGTLVRSIGKGVLGSWLSGGLLSGVAFDLKGNVWVANSDGHKIVKLSLDGQLLHDSNSCYNPHGMSVSPEGLIYTCDYDNRHVVVHDEGCKVLFAFGSRGRGLRRFRRPRDIALGSDGNMYVTDAGNRRVCVWSKEGTFMRDFITKYDPTCIAATRDDHLLITSLSSHIVMVCTLDGVQIHEFGGKGCHTGKFNEPRGICVDDSGVVYIADWGNRCVQVF